ncbi:MAG: 30S ribosomal protein S20 [Clostridia bacterium]|nr:30S ribosomal protein S20 [Clostridia bacterium]
MPNIKSAKKRVKTTEKRTQRNRFYKTRVKTEIKRFMAAVDAGDREEAERILPNTISTIDKAVSKGVLKKNNAANKKSRLQLKLNEMAE